VQCSKKREKGTTRARRQSKESTSKGRVECQAKGTGTPGEEKEGALRRFAKIDKTKYGKRSSVKALWSLGGENLHVTFRCLAQTKAMGI